MEMLQVQCCGTPYEIGYQHGQASRIQIESGLEFYRAYFKEKTGMEWPEIVSAAEKFLPMLERDWPHMLEEMEGVAVGSQVPFHSILALNVRTEISMGMVTDGCTSLAWKSPKASYLAQNWDWEPAQQDNLVVLHIKRDSKPSISMVTEAGIIGKIGLNSRGVGVCLNAIRVKGVDFGRLPGHLALRAVLDSGSRAEAVETITKAGIAAAMHILVADVSGVTSIEASSQDLTITETADGKIAHSNHFLFPHAETVPKVSPAPESVERIKRVYELMEQVEKEGLLSPWGLGWILKDEHNTPFGINKAGNIQEPLRTLFSIVMDLGARRGKVQLGRPADNVVPITLRPDDL